MIRIILCFFLACCAGRADTQADIEYARVDGRVLTLDLHRKPEAVNPPVVVYVHGGAWRAGSKSDMPLEKFLDHGFAIASVDYRLSTEAQFPAQIHDIKAAIRFLRATAGTWHIDARRIAIIGSSAGGHLAALAGVTNGHQELEGKVGAHLGQSSDVQCIVSFFGASNLQSILSQSTEFGLKMRVPALQLLLGGQPSEKPGIARLASPVAHLDKSDPPLLLLHGDADPQMPPEQSQEFAKACEAMKINVKLVSLPGSVHGGKEFYDQERIAMVADFVKDSLGLPRSVQSESSDARPRDTRDTRK
ncbi:MAG: alpha/beta hydrolase [Verrucomicrobiaceae bacterium]|nr:alpha/beta hydrolase [Verrucomicrobiaceae bacterium]